MKGFPEVSMRFPEIGSRYDLRLTRIDPRIDPPRLVPRWSPDDPQIPHDPDLRNTWSRIGYI